MAKNKAVFLDRDGTINVELGTLRQVGETGQMQQLQHVRQLRLLPGAAQAIKKIKKLGYRVIVITNQSVVACGTITEEQLQVINRELLRRLKARGAEVDAIYYCPHHPNANLIAYRKNCSCRKPKLALVRQAQKRFKIDLRRSFIVGDQTADIKLAEKAHLKSILVKTGFGGSDGKHSAKPDYVAKNLTAAVKIISRAK